MINYEGTKPPANQPPTNVQSTIPPRSPDATKATVVASDMVKPNVASASAPDRKSSSSYLVRTNNRRPAPTLPRGGNTPTPDPHRTILVFYPMLKTEQPKNAKTARPLRRHVPGPIATGHPWATKKHRRPTSLVLVRRLMGPSTYNVPYLSSPPTAHSIGKIPFQKPAQTSVFGGRKGTTAFFRWPASQSPLPPTSRSTGVTPRPRHNPGQSYELLSFP